ncbi:MAG: GNAT family N-acetyltransferase [Hyphomicrobiaceae bacterium]
MSQAHATPGTPRPTDVTVSLIPSRDLGAACSAALREMLLRSYDNDFTEQDWQHAHGGTHVLILHSAAIIAHAAVVPRRITFDDRPFRAGYVEAVAVDPAYQGQGLGSKVMTAAAGIIDAHFDLGVLSTGSAAFYERLGWVVWAGPSVVRRANGLFRSHDDDGGIMVRLGSRPTAIALTATIGCDDRAGDAW